MRDPAAGGCHLGGGRRRGTSPAPSLASSAVAHDVGAAKVQQDQVVGLAASRARRAGHHRVPPLGLARQPEQPGIAAPRRRSPANRLLLRRRYLSSRPSSTRSLPPRRAPPRRARSPTSPAPQPAGRRGTAMFQSAGTRRTVRRDRHVPARRRDHEVGDAVPLGRTPVAIVVQMTGDELYAVARVAVEPRAASSRRCGSSPRSQSRRTTRHSPPSIPTTRRGLRPSAAVGPLRTPRTHTTPRRARRRPPRSRPTIDRSRRREGEPCTSRRRPQASVRLPSLSKPRRESRAMNRGSSRRGSKKGRTWSHASSVARSSQARSSLSRVGSSSPSPAWTWAIRAEET